MLTRRSAMLVAASSVLWTGAAVRAFAQSTVALRGAGSTFAAPLWKKWIEEYGAHRNISISYDVVGSGEGVKRFLTETVDFAGSDEILTEAEVGKA